MIAERNFFFDFGSKIHLRTKNLEKGEKGRKPTGRAHRGKVNSSVGRKRKKKRVDGGKRQQQEGSVEVERKKKRQRR
jgi:hypothetical protein